MSPPETTSAPRSSERVRGASAHIETVEEADASSRLDQFVSGLAGVTRSRARRLVNDGAVSVNGEASTKPGLRLKVGDRVKVLVPAPEPLPLAPSTRPLEILYEDDHLVVVNKPPGMVVHPAPGHSSDTLVNVLLDRVGDLSGIGGVLRPGIVHRLDRETSGVLVAAKSDPAHTGLAQQFADKSVDRVYIALAAPLRGPGLDEEGTIRTLLGRDPRDRKRFTTAVTRGRRAVTHYRIVERFPCGALRVECRLETGRTHQIRVHLAERGCPLIGDRVYGGRAMRSVRLIERQALHARVLGFVHPVTGAPLRFEGDFPDDFQRAEDALRRGGDWR